MASAVATPHGHSRQAIRQRLTAPPAVNYLRDWIYGGIDGVVTTFAIVAGSIGADLSARIVLILGAANLLADGFSMAASNYSGTKTERDDYARLRAVENAQIDAQPQGEREEVREIFRLKGFRGHDLERAVDVVTADRDTWIDLMMAEEYGLGRAVRSPLRASLATFWAFVACGAVPLVPFLFDAAWSGWLSTALAGAVFFAIGSLKSRWSTAAWWRSGLETLLIGSAAAAIAYVIGRLLGGLA